MTFEEAKKELKSYRDAKQNQQILQTRIDILKQSSVGCASFGKRVQSSRIGCPVENKVFKIVELKEELENTKLYAECRANDIALKITKLEYPFNELLNLCYIQFWNDYRVMRKVNYTGGYYYRLKRDAIINYANLKVGSKR